MFAYVSACVCKCMILENWKAYDSRQQGSHVQVREATKIITVITLPWLLKEIQTDIHVWEHQNETINIPNMSTETMILDKK